MMAGNETSVLKVTAGLVLAGLLLFGASFNDPFHFDDSLIVNDTNVTNPARWHHFLNPLHLRQLTFFSFYLNHLVSGKNPAGYHVVNVGLHIANAALLFLLLKRILDQRIAIVAAGLFLVHPIQTEPVLYVYQRSVLLAALFSLLGLLAYQKRRPWLALIWFICSFESKESSLAVLFLLGFRGLKPADHKVRAETVTRWAYPLIAVLFAVAALALLSYRNEGTVGIGVTGKVTPIQYLLTQTRVIYTYLRLLVFPYGQSLEYDFPLIDTFNLRVLGQFAGLMVLVGLGFAWTRYAKWRTTGLSIIAFFILLAPTSSFIPSADFAFEHRLYLPMMAFAVFAASLIVRLKGSALVTAAILVPLSIVTLQRGTVWSSDIALWEDATQKAPNKARAWFNLGGARLQSDPARAQVAYDQALRLQPGMPEALYNLGVIQQNKGNSMAAVRFYQLALDRNADYWPAWNNLGNTLFALGDRERALSAFENTLRLNPDHWPSQYNIAIVHYTSSRFEKAIPRLRTVLAWQPEYQDARYLLAVCLSRAGQPIEAEREWKKLRINAGQPPMPAPLQAPTP